MRLADQLMPDGKDVDQVALSVLEAFEGWEPRWRETRADRRWRAYRHDLGDYMHRVILQAPGATLRLHKILRSDAGDLHDHPWDFTSRILRGSYLEQVPAERGVGRTHGIYRAGDTVSHRAEDLHRLEVLEGPVWTFVETGPRRREWGFATVHGWLHWKDYTGYRGGDDRGFE